MPQLFEKLLQVQPELSTPLRASEKRKSRGIAEALTVLSVLKFINLSYNTHLLNALPDTEYSLAMIFL